MKSKMSGMLSLKRPRRLSRGRSRDITSSRRTRPDSGRRLQRQLRGIALTQIWPCSSSERKMRSSRRGIRSTCRREILRRLRRMRGRKKSRRRSLKRSKQRYSSIESSSRWFRSSNTSRRSRLLLKSQKFMTKKKIRMTRSSPIILFIMSIKASITLISLTISTLILKRRMLKKALGSQMRPRKNRFQLRAETKKRQLQRVRRRIKPPMTLRKKLKRLRNRMMSLRMKPKRRTTMRIL